MNEDSIERLLKNYANARLSLEGWCYLNNIDLKIPNYQVTKLVDDNKLMFHVRYILSKDFHIELYKILKQNRNTIDNIFSLLQQVNTNEAKEHLEKFEGMRNEINSILDIRDKYYAHLDEDYKDFVGSFKVKDYYRIFDLIENAIIILGKKEALFSCLKEIASRDEFNLKEFANT